MILATMRFAGFEWEHNPVSLKISNELKQTKHTLPQVGERITDSLLGLKVYSGKGELVGKDCITQYRKLEEMFLSGRKGMLTIPGLSPVYACFSSLSVVGETTPDLLTYTFEFIQEQDGTEYLAESSEHVCAEGETLYDIAFDEGIALEILVELNPQIKRPDELKTGEKVRLC